MQPRNKYISRREAKCPPAQVDVCYLNININKLNENPGHAVLLGLMLRANNPGSFIDWKSYRISRTLKAEFKNYPHLDLTPYSQYKGIYLSHALISRECSKKRTQYHWEVCDLDPDKRLGQGAFADVFPCQGKIHLGKISEAVYVSYTQKPVQQQRIAKIFISGQVDLQEFFLLKRAGYFQVKCPRNLTAYSAASQDARALVMRRIPGVTLAELIGLDENDNKIKKIDLTFELRLDIAIELLYALKRLHQRFIIHRDIKPSNVMVDISTSPPKVYFIDLGLAKDAGTVDRGAVGTITYMPTEIWEGQAGTCMYNEKTDIWTSHWLLHLLFGGQPNPAKSYFDAKAIAENHRLTGLFSDMSDISDDSKITVKGVIAAMAMSSADKRINIDTAIILLKELRLRRDMIDSSFPEDAFLTARTKASLCRQCLENAERTYRVGFSAHFLFQKVIAEALDSIHEEPAILTVFLQYLRIEILYGLTSKTAVMEKVSSIEMNHNAAWHRLNLLKRRIDQSQYHFLAKLGREEIKASPYYQELLALKEQRHTLAFEFHEAESHYLSYPLTLENLELLSRKPEKVYRRFSEQLSRIDQKIVSLLVRLSQSQPESSVLNGSIFRAPADLGFSSNLPQNRVDIPLKK